MRLRFWSETSVFQNPKKKKRKPQKPIDEEKCPSYRTTELTGTSNFVIYRVQTFVLSRGDHEYSIVPRDPVRETMSPGV